MFLSSVGIIRTPCHMISHPKLSSGDVSCKTGAITSSAQVGGVLSTTHGPDWILCNTPKAGRVSFNPCLHLFDWANQSMTNALMLHGVPGSGNGFSSAVPMIGGQGPNSMVAYLRRHVAIPVAVKSSLLDKLQATIYNYVFDRFSFGRDVPCHHSCTSGSWYE